MRFLPILTIIYVLLLYFGSYAKAAESKVVLILGDSLSAAYGIDQKQGWVSLLVDELPDFKIVNASISGETTKGGLKRLPELLATHQPDYVIVELGANDGLRGQSHQLTRKNLSSIIDQSLDLGASVGLMEMHVPRNYGRRYSEQFNQIFHQLAEQETVTLIPFFLLNVSTDTELLQADGLHPKAEAQTIMLNNVLPHIKNMLGL